MGTYAPIGLLADAAAAAQNFVRVFAGIYVLLILAWVVLSWIQLPYSRMYDAVQEFLNQVVRPYLRLFRWLPTLGPFDLSPILGILVLLIAADIVSRLIGAFL
jgi:uncharacterized protein YggT (Ycf19 family)